MVTVLEIRKKSGKVKRAKILREKSGNFREKKSKVSGKSRNSDMLSKHKSLTILYVQSDDVSFYHNKVSIMKSG